jgi:N-acetylmuramic acid 6-phosphate etherase
MTVHDLLVNINKEDRLVPVAIEKVLDKVASLVEKVVEKMSAGGRLIYIGAGNRGSLGDDDATEIPPTNRMPHRNDNRLNPREHNAKSKPEQ